MNFKYWVQRHTRGWSDDEIWNMDYEFIKWLNSRFKKYKEEAKDKIDLNYYKFTYKNKKYTQLQIIDRIIELTDYILQNNYFDIKFKNKDIIIDEIFDLFRLVFYFMWW